MNALMPFSLGNQFCTTFVTGTLIAAAQMDIFNEIQRALVITELHNRSE